MNRENFLLRVPFILLYVWSTRFDSEKSKTHLTHGPMTLKQFSLLSQASVHEAEVLAARLQCKEKAHLSGGLPPLTLLALSSPLICFVVNTKSHTGIVHRQQRQENV